MIYLFDPLYPFTWRRWGYLWLAVFFARLAAWYWIVDRKGAS